MSETPERIEREMFEIRSGMASDMTDLRRHIEPQAVAEQVKKTIRQRLQEAVARVKANLRAKQQDFLNSVRRQLHLVRQAGEKRDPAPLTDAVKSDPRPLVLLVILLTVTLLMARKMTSNRGDED